jgi:5-methylcytosine-specific restriction endonuclease McrA
MIKRNKKGQFLKGCHWRSFQRFRDEKWLRHHYIDLRMSTGDIAKMFEVTDAAILFWMRKHKISRRSVSNARKIKHWGNCGIDNPMWNKKGKLNPNWRGGCSPERQLFYESQEWKSACSFVWKRDKATCRRCGIKRNNKIRFHIHHVVSFANKKLRAKPSNLILFCKRCHDFVHSKRNKNHEYISEK